MAIIAFGGSSNDVLIGGSGNDLLFGGGGNDKLYGYGGNDRLDGGAGNDQLYGGAGNDILSGGAGNDLLDGGTGSDQMAGGSGNDIYVVDSRNDKVIEAANQGTDEVRASIALTTAITNVENYTFTGAAAVHFTGNALNNRISGTMAADDIRGGDGNDVIIGNGGGDTLRGEAGNDTLDGGSGAAKLDGGAGNDTLIVHDLGFAQALGGSGEDTLRFAGSGFKIDFSQFAGTSIKDIERIDLSQSGADDLTLSKAGVEAASSTSNRLIIDGNKGDVLHLDAAFSASGTQTVGGETYALYKSGGDSVLVDQAISVNPHPAPIADLPLASLNGGNGFSVVTHEAAAFLGSAVSGIGDVNGDGYGDFVVGAEGAGSPSGGYGAAYVVFGGPAAPANPLDIGSLTAAEGFTIHAGAADRNLGISVGGGGDFNGDGVADMIVGSVPFDTDSERSGAAYVLFGSVTAGFRARSTLIPCPAIKASSSRAAPAAPPAMP